MGYGQPGVGPKISGQNVVHYVYAGGRTGDAGDIYYTRSVDNGSTWSTPIKLNSDGGSQTQWQPSMSVTAGGDIHVYWYDRRNSTDGQNYEIYGRRSADNGATFLPDEAVSNTLIPQPLQPDPNVQSCYAGDYNYASSFGDTHYATWTDGRVQVAGNPQQDVFFAAVRSKYTVAVSALPSSGGTATGGGQFPAGSTPTVTAIANSGYTFVNWAEGGIQVSTSPSYTLSALAADHTLVANFTPVLSSIATSAAPPGSGTTSGDSSFPTGSSRTVTATANSGFTFASWTEGGSVVSTSSVYTFTLTANRVLVANFVRSYIIAVSASPPAGGSVTGGGTFLSGSSRTVNATAASGFSFTNWTEAGGVVSTSATYTFTLNGNRNLVAHFAQGSYTVTTRAAPRAGGTTSGDGIFRLGTSVTVVARPNYGWSFDNWTERGLIVSSQRQFMFSLLADRDLVAQFSRHAARNDLLVDLGNLGLFELLNERTWLRIRPISPSDVAVGDLDGNGQDDAVATFPIPSSFPAGTWARYGDNLWRRLDSRPLSHIVTGDLDGDGRDDVIGSFAGQGLYVLMNNSRGFVRLNANTSTLRLATGDLDANGRDEVIAVFGNGTWIRYDNGRWVKLSDRRLVHPVIGDLDGNGQDDLVGDFPPLGIYAFVNNTRGLIRLRTTSSEGLAIGDLNGDDRDDIVAVLPSGTWLRYDNGQWQRIDARRLDHPVVGDLDDNGKGEVVGNFASTGLYARYNNAGPWRRLRAQAAQEIESGGFD